MNRVIHAPKSATSRTGKKAVGRSDATSTNQNLDNRTGVVVMASDETTGYYWHLDRQGSTTGGSTTTTTTTPGGGSGPGATQTLTLTPPPLPRPAPQASPKEASGLAVTTPLRGLVVHGHVRIAVARSRLRVVADELDGHGRFRARAGLVASTVGQTGTKRFSVALSRAARSSLARRGSLHLRLVITMTPPHGTPTVLRSIVTWRKPAPTRTGA